MNLVRLVSAAPVVEINVSSNFSQGDTIKFSYAILSSQNEDIKYVVGVSCPDSPEALLDLKEANLEANKLFSGEYSYGLVDGNVKSGDCMASISILEPYKLDFIKHFEISSDLSEFYVTPLICGDVSCSEKKKVFAQGEKIHINYTSSIEGVLVSGVLTFPDLSIQQITLPAYIDAEQVGTYNLYIIASKEGYKTVSLKEQFGVIKENANIEDATFKEGLVVKDNSNSLNQSGKRDSVDNILRLIIYILVGFVLLVAAVEVIKKFKYEIK